jgi:hypothetical protein
MRCGSVFACKHIAKLRKASTGAAFESIETFVYETSGHLHKFAMVDNLDPLLLIVLASPLADATEQLLPPLKRTNEPWLSRKV